MVGAEGWGPKCAGPKGGGPKIHVFFLLPPLPFSLFFFSRGVFSWNCGHGSRPWTTQSSRLVSLGSFCASRRSPGFHQSMKGSPRAQFWWSINEKTSPSEKKKRKWGGRENKTTK